MASKGTAATTTTAAAAAAPSINGGGHAPSSASSTAATNNNNSTVGASPPTSCGITPTAAAIITPTTTAPLTTTTTPAPTNNANATTTTATTTANAVAAAAANNNNNTTTTTTTIPPTTTTNITTNTTAAPTTTHNNNIISKNHPQLQQQLQQQQHQQQQPAVSRKRSHNEITMREPDDDAEDSDDSLELEARFPEPSQAANVIPAPFSHEPLADERRSKVDYSIKFTQDEARAGMVTRPIRVYADGIYDMFHTGHARQLMQAKMAFPNAYLIVGVCSDELTYEKKGRTVMADTERYEALRHCRYVDEVLTNAPWTVDLEFTEKHKIDFIAHDELPYTIGTGNDVYKFWKERGMFLATERTEGVSTTDVITRIIKDYDMYIRRNLARGYSHKELNVSYMKAKHLKLKDNYEKFESKLKDKGKNWMGRWKEHVGKYDGIIHRWEEKSKEFIGSFVDMFGKDGRLGQWIQENTTRIGRAISPSQSLGDDESQSPSHSGEGAMGGGGHGHHHPLYDSPPSPSTSDLDPSSPPHKRGRFSPLFMRSLHHERDGDDDDLSDKEED